jgi:hypothetical protein
LNHTASLDLVHREADIAVRMIKPEQPPRVRATLDRLFRSLKEHNAPQLLGVWC